MITFLILSLFSATSFASETYQCVGKDGKNKKSEIVLEFESNKKVIVSSHWGNDYNLEFNSKNLKYQTFADYEHDGYGGHVELRVPATFSISGSDATEEFKARFIVETYSEVGHVSTDLFLGKCQRADN